jgi:hypothetical protein
VPSATSIALDADTLSASTSAGHGADGLLGSSAEGTAAVGELPGESWLALGLGNLDALLGNGGEGLRSLASIGSSLGGSGSGSGTQATGGLTLNGVLEAILKPLGILAANSAEARRDFQSWMGPVGIFASGTGLVDLKAGIVITSTNPAGSRAAVGELAVLLRKAGASAQPVSIAGAQAAVSVELTGLPVTLDVVDGSAADGQTKFVIGLSEASVAAALNPSSTLSVAASYSAAATTLGEGIRPSLTLDFPTFLGLFESLGLLEGPSVSKLVPYLRTFTTLAGGGRSVGGGVERLRLVLGLAHTE